MQLIKVVETSVTVISYALCSICCRICRVIFKDLLAIVSPQMHHNPGYTTTTSLQAQSIAGTIRI